MGSRIEDYIIGIAFTATNWLLKVIIALVLYYIGKRLITFFLNIIRKMLEKSSLDEGVSGFLCSICKVGMYGVLFLILFDYMGFQTTSLLALFGSAALAIGMSLQGSLSNFAGGVLILIFKPFVVGDFIIVKGEEGEVKSIGILYTRVLTYDNNMLVLPNGVLANQDIINTGDGGIRRVRVPVSISYTADVDKARKVLMDLILSDERVIKDRNNAVIVKGLDDSAVTLEGRIWTSSDDYWNVMCDMTDRFKKTLEANNIEIPFNQLDVHIIENK